MTYEEAKKFIKECGSFKNIEETSQKTNKSAYKMLSFEYGKDLTADIKVYDSGYVILNIGAFFKPKLFTKKNIENAFIEFIQKFIEIPSDYLEFVYYTNVSDANRFTTIFDLELMDLLLPILDAFRNDYIPSISKYIK